MRIEEAIELLGGYVYEDKPCPVGLFDEATRLGIEALKRFKEIRADPCAYNVCMLPGETKE